MEPLIVHEGLTIGPEFLSVSFTRDLGDDGGPEAARRVPTSVELRLDVAHCDDLDDVQQRQILSSDALGRGGRGTVRVVCCEHKSRGRNLNAARTRLATLVRYALEDVVASDHPEPELELERPRPRPRRRGAGLFKRKR